MTFTADHPMLTDPLDDLAEARAKIEAMRAAFQAALDGEEPPEAVRQAVERLERMESELERTEDMVAAREGLVI